MSILHKKNLKYDYSKDVIEVVNAMAIDKKKIEIVGSMALKTILYPNDYDCYEVLHQTAQQVKTKFQSNIRKLMEMKNIYIGDIKIGEINNEPVRWNALEILQGEKNGYKLLDGIKSKAMFKLDVISLIGITYKDFSVVYEFHKRESKTAILEKLNIEMKELLQKKQYFKCLKRIFSQAKLEDDKEVINTLLPFFNGDVGRLYNVSSDINTLLYLLENYHHLSNEKINYEIDYFKNRFSNIELPDFISSRKTIIDLVNKSEKGSDKLKTLLTLKNKLDNIIQSKTNEFIKKIHIKL